MIISQADPSWSLVDYRDKDYLRNPQTLKLTTIPAKGSFPDGYEDYLLALRREVVAFKKPVAYVHGDSHYYL
jgi:hypothetical protein